MPAKEPGKPPAPTSGIRSMQPEDRAQAAQLHQRVFPDYFLSHMGQRFLECFYGDFSGPPGNYGFVAVCEATLVGAVIGTADSSAFYDRFYRRNWGIATLALARGLVLDPFMRQNITTRIVHIPIALRAIVGRRKGSAPQLDPGQQGAGAARLLSIGVDPQHRGQGIAAALVDSFCQRLRSDGITEVGLSVRADNHGAIAFYTKTGWQREHASDTTIRFRRPTQAQPGE